MVFQVIIPARYNSTRLPGKVLLDIAGKTMIQRVYEQAVSSSASNVIVATDDERIEAEVISFGGQCCLTRSDHPSGTDRLEEVVTKLGLDNDEVIVNVQGDEPLIPPQAIDQVAKLLSKSAEAGMATLCEPIVTSDEIFDPNAVKVVFDDLGNALYFSRAPIPWDRQKFASREGISGEGIEPEDGYYRHIGIYGYRVSLLHQYVNWPLASLEKLESLEQLRVLCNGVTIKIAATEHAIPGGIDTPHDLQRVRDLLS